MLTEKDKHLPIFFGIRKELLIIAKIIRLKLGFQNPKKIFIS